jgi:DNA-binding YbaB/EbfC family protein
MSNEDNPFGGMDMNALFSQAMESAKTFKGKMEQAQAEAALKTVEGQSGGGIVTVTATGKGRIKSIKIDPVAVDARDVEMLEDLLVAATNDALRRASELMDGQLGGVAKGMDLGGLGDLLGKIGE